MSATTRLEWYFEDLREYFRDPPGGIGFAFARDRDWHDDMHDYYEENYCLPGDFLLSNVYRDERRAGLFCRAFLVEQSQNGVSFDTVIEELRETVEVVRGWEDAPIGASGFPPSPHGRPSSPALPDAELRLPSPASSISSPMQSPTNSASDSVWDSVSSLLQSSPHDAPRPLPPSHSLLNCDAANTLDDAPGDGRAAGFSPGTILMPTWTCLCLFVMEWYTLFPMRIFINICRRVLQYALSCLLIYVLVSFCWQLAVQWLQNLPIIGPSALWISRVASGPSLGGNMSWVSQAAYRVLGTSSRLGSILEPLSGLASLLLGVSSVFQTQVSVETHVPPPGFNLSTGFQGTINNTARLSELSIGSMPILLSLQYSSHSIVAARSIVSGSDFLHKDKLIAEYDFLESNMDQLSGVLEKFQVEATVMIMALDAQLEACIRDTNQRLDKLGPGLTNVAFKGSVVSSTSCGVALAYRRHIGLPSARCSASFLASMYTYCIATPEPWGVLPCQAPRWISSVFSAQDESVRNYTIQPIMTFLGNFYHGQTKLLVLAENGTSLAKDVRVNFGKINALRTENKNRVMTKLQSIYAEGQNPRWYQRLLYNPTLQSQLQAIPLEGQMRNQQELENIHNTAESTFREITTVLHDLGMEVTVLAKYVISRKHDTNALELHSLRDELARLPPCLDNLRNIQARLDAESDNNRRERAARANRCQGRGWDWADCMSLNK